MYPPITIKFGTPLHEVERLIIMETLLRHRYNRTKTARVLQIGIRTLQRKLKEYESQSEQESTNTSETNVG